MNSFDWLIGCRFKSLERREHDWVLRFEGKALIVISCLWRLLEANHIRRTSSDEGQWFGLAAPVDAARDVNSLLRDASVESVTFNSGTLDIEFDFDTGHKLQVFPESSGYEAWTAMNQNTEFIAVGGGRLDIMSARWE